MKRAYSQLTSEERYHIATMIKLGKSSREIARGMDRSPSTISRELKRNKGKRGYREKQAHEMAMSRHSEKPKAIKLTDTIISYIKEKLKSHWSPEQICGRLSLEEGLSLSTETVYRFIEKDKQLGGDLHTYLRHHGKKRRKRYGNDDYRGKIPGRIDISERPAIVDERTRIGDWEADLIIGKGHKGAIVTLAERCSKVFLALPISNKTAELTKEAIVFLLTAFKNCTYTITYDNGREFNAHEAISKSLECQGFFARPYHSWERGLNENSNGLLRQYFPKSMALDNVSVDEVFAATEEMNNRPRKSLGFKTPWEVFNEMTSPQLQAQ